MSGNALDLVGKITEIAWQIRIQIHQHVSVRRFRRLFIYFGDENVLKCNSKPVGKSFIVFGPVWNRFRRAMVGHQENAPALPDKSFQII